MQCLFAILFCKGECCSHVDKRTCNSAASARTRLIFHKMSKSGSHTLSQTLSLDGSLC